jgi:AcrR family transcriptional regulator
LTPPPSSAPDTAPRRRRSRETHDRLARAALELFTTKGYHGTTTPLIAARAGVAEGTIYRHFASKDDLLNEVFRAGVRVLRTPVREAAESGDCRTCLDRVATRWAAIAAREPALVRLVFDASLVPLFDERSRTAARELRADVEQLVAAGKAAGEVRAGGADLWTEVWLRLARLVLDRVADGTWRPDDPGPGLVRSAAWDAIRAETAGAPVVTDSSTQQGDRS